MEHKQAQSYNGMKFYRDGEEINPGNIRQILGDNFVQLLMLGPIMRNGVVFEMKREEVSKIDKQV